jgi:hypothetical protein
MKTLKTKNLKINGENHEGFLMAGGPGYRIYVLLDRDLFANVVAVGRKYYLFPKDHPDFKTVAEYANLPYFTEDAKPAIEKNFKELLNKLA